MSTKAIERWRRKTYTVSGTLKGYWEAGHSYLISTATIGIGKSDNLLAYLGVSAGPDAPEREGSGRSSWCNCPDCEATHVEDTDIFCPRPDTDCETGAGRYGCTVVSASGSIQGVPYNGGILDWVAVHASSTQVDWYKTNCCGWIWPDCDMPNYTQDGEVSIPFSLEVEFETDLKLEALGPGTPTPLCICHTEGCAPPGQLFCGRNTDCSACWLQDHRIKTFESLSKDGTNEYGDYGTIYIRASVGDHTLEFTRQMLCSVDISQYNELIIYGQAIPSSRDIDDPPIQEEKLTHDIYFERTFTDGESYHTYNATMSGPIPSLGGGWDGSATFVLNGNNLKAYFKGASVYDDNNAMHSFRFRDIAGAWDVDYSGPIADCTVDGTFSPRNVHIVSDIETHPILKPADESHPTPWWCWDVAQGATPVEFTGNDGHQETWGGKWELQAHNTILEGQPYYVGSDLGRGYCRFVDTPQDSEQASHGSLHVHETRDYKEPWCDYDNDGVLERGHVMEYIAEEWVDTGHEQDDGRVLLKCGIAPDVTHFKAATLNVGMVAGGQKTILDFNSLDGWTKSNDITLGIDDFGLYITGFSEGESAWIQKDFTSTKKRLTGTRFLKVDWYSQVSGGQMRMTISGQSWVLTANGSGAQTTIVDMALPEQSVDQMQSLIPIERPQDFILPKTEPQPEHAINLGKGWGVGRIGIVRFDFLTPGSNYKVKSVSIYRRSELDGGRMEMWLTPQAAFNNNRASVPNSGVGGAVNGAGDTGVMFAGEHKVYDEVYHTYTSWEDYYQIAGIVHVDGCVIAEIAIGGQQWYKKEGCEGWTWSWFNLSSNFFPMFPMNDYQKMGDTVDPPSYFANNVLSIVPEDPPNWGLLPNGQLDYKLPANLVAYLDPYFGPVTSGQELWATVRADSFTHHIGFGKVVGGVEKYFRGLVWGIAFEGSGASGKYARQGTTLHLLTEEGENQQHLMTTVDKLGLFYFDNVQSRLANAEAEVNDNRDHAVTIYPRNRGFIRALLTDLVMIHGPTYHPSLGKPTYVPELNRPEYI